jgi:hypothetical protein
LKIFRMLDRTASDQCKVLIHSSSKDRRSADRMPDHYYQRRSSYWVFELRY